MQAQAQVKLQGEAAEVVEYFRAEIERDIASLFQTINKTKQVIGPDSALVAVAESLIDSARIVLARSLFTPEVRMVPRGKVS